MSLALQEANSRYDAWKDGAMSVVEASKFTGLGRTKLLEMAYSGEIASTTVGKRRLFSRAGLIGLLAKGDESVSG